VILYLQKTVDYIENNSRAALNLDLIAKHVGFSKFYLNHMFRIYTGFSVMEYVRRKKLELALDDLKTDRRIIDIALDMGYSSERAFSRAVQQMYGHSPNYFRKNNVLKTRSIVIYNLELMVDEEQVLADFPPSFDKVRQNIILKGRCDMKQYLSNISYEIIDSMTVLSGTVFGREPEETVMAVMNRLAQKYQIKILRSFGFDVPIEGNEDVMEKRGYEYWISIDESALAKLPGTDTFDFEGVAIKVKKIPAYRYAKLRIDDPFADPFERIGSGWRCLVSWLEEHDFKEADLTGCEQAYCLEEVKENEGVVVMDIYVPVDKG
jgi:AraC family transcriptional regulator